MPNNTFVVIKNNFVAWFDVGLAVSVSVAGVGFGENYRVLFHFFSSLHTYTLTPTDIRSGL